MSAEPDYDPADRALAMRVLLPNERERRIAASGKVIDARHLFWERRALPGGGFRTEGIFM